MSDYGLPDDEDDAVGLSLGDDIFPPTEAAEAVYEPVVRADGRHRQTNPRTTGLAEEYCPGEHEYTVGFDRRIVERLNYQARRHNTTPEHIIDRAVRHYLDWLEMYFS